jgi:hypothetical protein
MAARLDPQALPANIESQVTESVESGFDEASGAVFSRRRRRYGALVLEDRMVPADPDAIASTLAGVVARRIGMLPWTEAARQLQARAALARSLDRTFPDISDDALARGAQDWLAPRLAGMTRLAELARLDLLSVLRDHIGWDDCRPAAPAWIMPRQCRKSRPRRRRSTAWATRRAWQAAGCRCVSPCSLLQGGRWRSPRTWRDFGRAPGPMSGATCAAAIPSTTGRKTRRFRHAIEESGVLVHCMNRESFGAGGQNCDL